jgi:hypothetical protein
MVRSNRPTTGCPPCKRAQEDVKDKTYRENRSCHQLCDDEGSTSPKKSPNPHHKSGTDDYVRYNVGSKPKTKEKEGHTKI